MAMRVERAMLGDATRYDQTEPNYAATDPDGRRLACAGIIVNAP